MNRKDLLLAVFVLSGCGGGSAVVEVVPVPPGDAERGRDVFLATCRECHGADAKGIPGAGDNLTVSTFIPAKSDAELVAFVKTGRMMNDPVNKTGIAMPPYGSNPKLTDQEIVDAITFIRSLAVEPQTATNGSTEAAEDNCS
jgi:cytochrome c5